MMTTYIVPADKTYTYAHVGLGHSSVDHTKSNAVWQYRDSVIDAGLDKGEPADGATLDRLSEIARTLEYWEAGLIECACLPDGQPCYVCRAIAFADNPEYIPF